VLDTTFRAAAAAPLAYDIRLAVPQSYRSLLESNLDIYTWRGNPRMNDAQLRRLVADTPGQIRTLLSTEGFYKPEIKVDLRAEAEKPVVVIEIVPGEPVRVADFELGVTGSFDDGSEENRARLSKLRTDWPLRHGEIFRHPDWEKAKRKSLLSIAAYRYPAARIAASQATVDPDNNQAHLMLKIDSGPAFSFGELEISGLNRYPESIVARLNPIQPGEAYEQSKLLEFQSRLRDSPYFVAATVSAETGTGEAGRIPVKVVVEEQHSKKLGFGAGVSTDTGPSLSLDYGDLNLLDRAWRLSASAKIDASKQTLNTGLEFPGSASGYRDSLHATAERTDIEEQITRALTLGAKRSRVRGKIERTWGLDFTTEQQEAGGSITDTHKALTASHTWTRRDVDDLLYPTRGTLLQAQIGGGAKALLSDEDFLRGYGRYAWFRPLGERGSVILRGEAGAVLSKDRQGIPSDLLFRTGGDQSVRGYGYQSLGVQDGDAIVGGRYLVVASAEYIYWVRPKWGAAFFYDIGDAADEPSDLSPRHGYGIGARWKSPIGPLNLDVAYGEEARQLRLHFSASLAF
jgi:translocation and assembly module TamA